MTTTVDIDASAVIRMLTQIAENAGAAASVVQREAQQSALPSITNVVRGATGNLASSFRVRNTATGALIVNDAYYARFVHLGYHDRGGNWHPGRPPQVNYTSDQLAAAVLREVVR